MEVLAGRVTHYYSKLGVAAVEVRDTLQVDDMIHIKGHTTDFEQKVENMQLEHQQINKASRGQVIGLKVKDHVREHDSVFRVEA